jgi:hypothetical protein
MHGLIEYDGREESLKKVSLKEILEQHEKTYKLSTKIGDFILKQITYLDLEDFVIRQMLENKEYRDLMSEANILYELKKVRELNGEEIKKLSEIGEKTKKVSKEISLPCFVDPKLNTVNELNAILSKLDNEDRGKLLNALAKLTNPSFEGELATTGLVIAKAYGVKMPENLNLKNMTAQQGLAFISGLSADTEASKKILEEIARMTKGLK